jgi:hypothetical protein
MEVHAAMDMTIQAEGTLWQRLRSRQAFTSVSHIFVMEWAAVIRDIVIGLLLAGALCYRFVCTGGIPMLKMMAAHPKARASIPITPARARRPRPRIGGTAGLPAGTRESRHSSLLRSALSRT